MRTLLWGSATEATALSRGLSTGYQDYGFCMFLDVINICTLAQFKRKQFQPEITRLPQSHWPQMLPCTYILTLRPWVSIGHLTLGNACADGGLGGFLFLLPLL